MIRFARPSQSLVFGRRACLGACAMGLLITPTIACADDDASRSAAIGSASRAKPELDRGTYVHLLGTLSIGAGLRFNNPYRLDRPLGSTAESVSLSARYLDLGGAVLFHHAGRFQHGAHLHWSRSLSGISQAVLTPSYIGLYRPSASWMAYGRAGVPFVLSPDSNVGGEIAMGGAVYVLTGVGVTAEVGATGFYGAATREVAATFIPIVYAQAGLAFDLEFLR